jgi:ABC-type glycerol-3-phosphate transport system substrate-binding protein
MMMKTILPALSALGLLAACSGGADAPKDDAAAKAEAPAADDDNDSAAPAPAKAEEDHPHDGSEGAEHEH